MAELVSRRVLAERRRVRDRVLHEVLEIERRHPDDEIVTGALTLLRGIAAGLEGAVDVEVHCIMNCGKKDRVTVTIEDPQRTVPNTMLCGACSARAEENP